MLDNETKRRIDTARDILVGKVPDPKSQVEQITIALIYKFMDDMDAEAEKLGGERKFFSGEYEQYGWKKLMAQGMGGFEVLTLYAEAIQKLNINPNIPQLFRDIFKNAYLPYRDPQTLKSFLKTIDEFNYDHSERLGDAFEYLLSVLGSQGDAGQFRTPRHIIDFMVYLVDPKKNETILDPACGTAGFLISSYKHIVKSNSSNFNSEGQNDFSFGEINGERYSGDKLTPDERTRLALNIKGYDISPDMVRLSLVNLYLHGFANPKISEYDTLTSEEKWNEHSDIILANPPFMSPKGGIKPHKRFSVESSRSEVLFVDYIAEHLTPNGRAAVIVPEGIIFQSGTAYKTLRKMLVENYLYAVISLPSGVFNPYSGVKTSILLMDKSLAKKTDKVLFAKVENDGFDLGAQRRANEKSELPTIAKAVKDFAQSILNRTEFDTESYKNLVFATKEKIGENGDWGLSGQRYKIVEKRCEKYEIVELSDVVEILDNLRRPITQNERKPGQYPYYGATGIVDYVQDYLFDERLVLVGEDGAKWGFGEKTAFIAEGKYWVNNHAHVLRPIPDKLLHRYLVEVLNEMDLSSYITGVTVPKLNQAKLRSIQIPLPPLEIQKEIVSEIEGWQKIIDGARQVVENYKPQIEIDPSWKMVELGEVCEINPKKSELANISRQTQVSFVPMADIAENEMFFTPKQQKQLEEVISGYTYFRDDDVLLAKVTPCFENGKAGVAKKLKNQIGFGSSELFVLRATKSVSPRWIYCTLITNKFRELGKLSMTGTGGLQRITREFITNYKIPLPTIDIQEERIKQIENEIEIVNKNKELITIFEAKIKVKIAKVCGE